MIGRGQTLENKKSDSSEIASTNNTDLRKPILSRFKTPSPEESQRQPNHSAYLQPMDRVNNRLAQSQEDRRVSSRESLHAECYKPAYEYNPVLVDCFLRDYSLKEEWMSSIYFGCDPNDPEANKPARLQRIFTFIHEVCGNLTNPDKIARQWSRVREYLQQRLNGFTQNNQQNVRVVLVNLDVSFHEAEMMFDIPDTVAHAVEDGQDHREIPLDVRGDCPNPPIPTGIFIPRANPNPEPPRSPNDVV